MMEYDITLGGGSIGRARVEREGLYYRFSCRVKLSGEVVCRLSAHCGDKTVSLGIPVPKDGAYELSTRIPVKRLGEGAMVITAEPKHTAPGGRFVPLSPQEPFAYLRQLENAFLQVRSGQVGAVIQDDPHPPARR